MLEYYFLPGAQVLSCVFPIPFISEAGHAIIDTNTNEYLPYIKILLMSNGQYYNILLLWSLIVVSVAA